jgi:F-box associated protein
MNSLPNDVLKTIFGFLSTRSWFAAQLVCKRWFSVASSDYEDKYQRLKKLHTTDALGLRLKTMSDRDLRDGWTNMCVIGGERGRPDISPLLQSLYSAYERNGEAYSTIIWTIGMPGIGDSCPRFIDRRFLNYSNKYVQQLASHTHRNKILVVYASSIRYEYLRNRKQSHWKDMFDHADRGVQVILVVDISFGQRKDFENFGLPWSDRYRFSHIIVDAECAHIFGFNFICFRDSTWRLWDLRVVPGSSAWLRTIASRKRGKYISCDQRDRLSYIKKNSL